LDEEYVMASGLIEKRRAALAKRKAAKSKAKKATAHGKSSTGKMAKDIALINRSTAGKGESSKAAASQRKKMVASVRRKQARKANYAHEG
jgi:hypothetical protein